MNRSVSIRFEIFSLIKAVDTQNLPHLQNQLSTMCVLIEKIRNVLLFLAYPEYWTNSIYKIYVCLSPFNVSSQLF